MRKVVLAALLIGVGSQPFLGSASAAGKPTPIVLTVKSSPNPSTVGREVTIVATVRITGPATTVGPTGSIDIFDGSTLLGAAPIVNGQGGVTASMTATFTPGGHPLIARYAGDANFASSRSAPALHIVAPRPPQ